MDHLRFVTSHGRSLAVGRSKGGDPFLMKPSMEGGTLCGLQGGAGGHLHNIRALFENRDMMNEAQKNEAAHLEPRGEESKSNITLPTLQSVSRQPSRPAGGAS